MTAGDEPVRDGEELKLPDAEVTDLEPAEEDADDVTGGKVPGQRKYNNIVLKRGADT